MLKSTIQTIRTPIGPMSATWTSGGLYSLVFTQSDDSSIFSGKSSKNRASLLMRELADAVENYFECGSIQWRLELLDWTGVTVFHQKLLHACFAIPSGQTKTYGELAADCGRPQAARAAGQAMAKNRWPILIPCHRVVGSTGKLTGYSGIGGLETKQQLLDLETSKALISAH